MVQVPSPGGHRVSQRWSGLYVVPESEQPLLSIHEYCGVLLASDPEQPGEVEGLQQRSATPRGVINPHVPEFKGTASRGRVPSTRVLLHMQQIAIHDGVQIFVFLSGAARGFAGVTPQVLRRRPRVDVQVTDRGLAVSHTPDRTPTVAPSRQGATVWFNPALAPACLVVPQGLGLAEENRQGELGRDGQGVTSGDTTIGAEHERCHHIGHLRDGRRCRLPRVRRSDPHPRVGDELEIQIQALLCGVCAP
jgi:hypothetical protein